MTIMGRRKQQIKRHRSMFRDGHRRQISMTSEQEEDDRYSSCGIKPVRAFFIDNYVFLYIIYIIQGVYKGGSYARNTGIRRNVP